MTERHARHDDAPRHVGGGLLVVQSMDERVPLVTSDELRKAVGLLLVLAEDDDGDIGVEAGRLARDFALRLPED